ncbi:MAG: hypothetical protein KAY03_01175 [Arenimonas sp.]|nr:hypothetical protein [Arenimonas sp.]
MKELRMLLIDCRLELRKLVRDFHKTGLSERLDVAVQSLAATAEADADGKGPPSAARARAIRETSNQVALAWQMAARDLKFSNPPLYDALSKKVMARLETKTLVDQVDELRQMEDKVADLHRQQAEAENARLALEAERDTLLGALATAVPQLGDGGDRLGVALARIDWLKAQAVKAAPSTALSTTNEEETRIPNDEVMAIVAAGARQFTKAQREWCVGEAMVLSGFQHTPMELIEQGDAHIARIIIGAKRSH